MNQEERRDKELKSCQTEQFCVWSPSRNNHTQKAFLGANLSPIFPLIKSSNCFNSSKIQEGHSVTGSLEQPVEVIIH
jgi:hypothetical protein